MKWNVNVLIVGIALSSCGQGAKELAQAQARRDDSVRTATRLQVERTRLLKDSLLTIQSQTEGMNNRLIIDKANLDAAKDKLNVIKQYQFMRTVAEREEQVRNQTITIQQLEAELANGNLQLKRHYESIAALQAQLIAKGLN